MAVIAGLQLANRDLIYNMQGAGIDKPDTCKGDNSVFRRIQALETWRYVLGHCLDNSY
jgi:hypothetical protein